MMRFYLTHARHGKKIAYQFHECEADKKMGWKEVTEDQFYESQKQKPKEEPPKDEGLANQYEAKYGKKPHHKMKDETIKAALDDSAA